MKSISILANSILFISGLMMMFMDLFAYLRNDAMWVIPLILVASGSAIYRAIKGKDEWQDKIKV